MKTVAELYTAARIAEDQRRHILYSTEIRPADDWSRPYRYVLRILPGNAVTPYVVHCETDPFQPHAATHAGNYCENIAEAFKAISQKSYTERLKLRDFLGNRVKRGKVTV